MRALLFLLALGLGGCVQRTPNSPTPTRLPLDLDHEVFVATENSLARFQAVPSGLVNLKTLALPVESPVAMAVNPDGLLYWRDWEMFSYTRDLRPRAYRFVNLEHPYRQGFLSATTRGFVANPDQDIQMLGPRLGYRGKLKAPGFVESLLVHEDTGYVLDPAEGQELFLLKVDLSDLDRPRLIEQVQFARAPSRISTSLGQVSLGKGSHWLDLNLKRWYVLYQGQVLVFPTQDLARGPSERLPGLPSWSGGKPRPGFRLWVHSSIAPIWGLGWEGSHLQAVSLEMTRQGLVPSARLELIPSEYPLQSAPFIQRVGSRVYASDGGVLWVIDVAGGQPVLRETRPYRHGLTLAVLNHPGPLNSAPAPRPAGGQPHPPSALPAPAVRAGRPASSTAGGERFPTNPAGGP